MTKLLTCVMADGTKWGVPVSIIARNRAEHYAHEFGGDVERSLAEDTIPLFDADAYEVQDWAVNNMNWSDFNGHHVKLENAVTCDFENDWMHGDKEVIEVTEATGATP